MAETKFDRLAERVEALEKLLTEKVKEEIDTHSIQLTKNSSGVFEEVHVIPQLTAVNPV